MKNNLLHLSLLSFLCIAIITIFSSDIKGRAVKTNELKSNEEETVIIKPSLKDGVLFPIVSAQSVLAIDLLSKTILYEKNPDQKLLPASTTKIVTALVALQEYELDQIMKVGKVNVTGQKMGLKMGEQLLFSDLLNGLLIYSANDAAEVIAESHPLGRNAFISLMNEKVLSLGLTNTHFTNPTGLDSGDQYLTARDLSVISEYAMDNLVFSEIVATKERIVKSIDNKNTHKLVNINKLVGDVPGVLGVKTGWTENARENLVTYIERDNKKVMIVVLGSSDRFGETRELIEWIFESYSW